jgi:hypothetical protein
MSNLEYAVNELRAAIVAHDAEPLPCSGMQAMQRSMRVFFARRAFLYYFSGLRTLL